MNGNASKMRGIFVEKRTNPATHSNFSLSIFIFLGLVFEGVKITKRDPRGQGQTNNECMSVVCREEKISRIFPD